MNKVEKNIQFLGFVRNVKITFLDVNNMTTTIFRKNRFMIAYDYTNEMWIHPISGQFVQDLDLCFPGWSEQDKYDQLGWEH